jgi:peptidyl-tRNA hydrolase
MQSQQELGVVRSWEMFGEMKIVLKVKSEQELRELENKVTH